MESVDRWPLASPDTQIPGGSRPAGAALCGRVRGAPACGPVLRGYSGGNWMVVVAPPVRRGRSARPGDACRPFWIHLHTLRPSGGSWARRGQPRLRGGRLARAPIRY
ncbi:hypothetical protein KXV62_007143 [Aspergillus fumigatus]|nr:hypothetical protein KXV62_007143 [Aspergillus fumigatus]